MNNHVNKARNIVFFVVQTPFLRHAKSASLVPETMPFPLNH